MLYQFKFFSSLLVVVFFTLTAPGTSANAAQQSFFTISANCPIPDVTYTGIKNGAFSFDIKGSGNTVQYKYTRWSDNFNSGTMTTGNGELEIGVSTPGAYSVYFRTVCGNEVSEWFPIDDIYL